MRTTAHTFAQLRLDTNTAREGAPTGGGISLGANKNMVKDMIQFIH